MYRMDMGIVIAGCLSVHDDISKPLKRICEDLLWKIDPEGIRQYIMGNGQECGW